MMARGYAFQLVLLTALCVLGIFFFPAARGPYSAVHGPTTALESVQACGRIFLAIVLCAFAPVRLWSCTQMWGAGLVPCDRNCGLPPLADDMSGTLRC